MKKSSSKNYNVSRQINFKKERLNGRMDEIQRKIKRAKKLYDDAVKLEEKLEIYNSRMARIKNYLYEISEIEMLLSMNTPVIIVPSTVLDSKIEQADFAVISFEGDFCKAVLLSNYPGQDTYLITMSALPNV